MDDFGKSRAVHTVTWPKIAAYLQKLNCQDHYISLKQRRMVCERIEQVTEQARIWLKPLIDLSEFRYAYHVNGTHESISQWLAAEKRPIYVLRGEYTYVMHAHPAVMMVDDLNDIPKDAVVYLSNPFSSNGRYHTYHLQTKNPVVLDIAYAGTTALDKQISIGDNVEQIFWSGSKPFGIGNFRTGLRFQRYPNRLQDELKQTGYFNLLTINLLSMCMDAMHVGHAWAAMHDDYTAICRRNNLIPSDTYLMATGHDSSYEHFKREDGSLRVPVGRILNEIYGYKVRTS